MKNFRPTCAVAAVCYRTNNDERNRRPIRKLDRRSGLTSRLSRETRQLNGRCQFVHLAIGEHVPELDYELPVVTRPDVSSLKNNPVHHRVKPFRYPSRRRIYATRQS
jgi:hypothetical protein